ncbi:MAG: hypothetical protein HC910_06535 [Spirulinaceae cyanobacterium SM2_1_0]|nr:hypothetical protein [Spirulinaceae cyanobacterium SM2_1_0]
MRNTTTLPEIAREGWSVQIYSSDRRLLCSFEPSHAWTLVAGFGAGFLLALLSVGHLQPQVTASEHSAEMQAPLQLD